MSKTPFIPHELPLQNLDWQKLLPMVGRANAMVARYDGLLQSMINPAVLLSPLTTQEAVLSSKIEGTQATLGEVLQHEAGEKFDEKTTHDIFEIQNYRRALLEAEDFLKGRKLSLNLIRQMHAVLLDGVRGRTKDPGKFRNDQNWIGADGCSMEQARYIPPNPLVMQDHLIKLDEYINTEGEDILIQLAVLHAQFEIIHPFKDGNGRIGRILVPLFLYQHSLLHRPMFYLSQYIEQNKEEYIHRLFMISEQKDWQGWIEFFLKAVLAQADCNIAKARNIQTLYEEMKKAFMLATDSKYAQLALDAFFRQPIINSTAFLNLSHIQNRATASSLLKALVDRKLITLLKTGAGQLPSVYAMPKLLNIAEGRIVINDQ